MSRCCEHHHHITIIVVTTIATVFISSSATMKRLPLVAPLHLSKLQLSLSYSSAFVPLFDPTPPNKYNNISLINKKNEQNTIQSTTKNKQNSRRAPCTALYTQANSTENARIDLLRSPSSSRCLASAAPFPSHEIPITLKWPKRTALLQ